MLLFYICVLLFLINANVRLLTTDLVPFNAFMIRKNVWYTMFTVSFYRTFAFLSLSYTSARTMTIYVYNVIATCRSSLIISVGIVAETLIENHKHDTRW